MSYYREYKGYEVHLKETTRGGEHTTPECVSWEVVGFGSVRSSGAAGSRQEACLAACISIDGLEADPYRFPVNLVGYPEYTGGDVVSRDGEVLGKWRMADYEALDIVEFIPASSEEVLYREHFINVLCADICKWHEGTSSQ